MLVKLLLYLRLRSDNHIEIQARLLLQIFLFDRNIQNKFKAMYRDFDFLNKSFGHF